MILYDTPADVLRKALRGLDLAPARAAEQAGLPEKDVLAATRGTAPADLLAKLAPALGLDPAALAALADYVPEAPLPPGVTRLELPFDDETVNAWLIGSGDLPLLIDTGSDRDGVRQLLEKRGLTGVAALITHDHRDHTRGLTGLAGIARDIAGPAGVGGGILEAGMTFTRGDLRLRAIGLPGHCDGALGYLVENRQPMICATGDALFAGSIGGCPPGKPYRDALAALRREVMGLPGDTLLLPGHGPATTVGQERRANPFLAINAAAGTP